MKTIDELLQYKLSMARKSYQREVRHIRKNITRDHMINTLEERIKTQLTGCATSNSSDSIFVYLSPEHNISKDWMCFMDENKEYLSTLGKGEEYTVGQDQSFGSYDYNWPEFKIYVNYNNGKCKRVKIGTKSRTIKEDIYEVQCL